MQFKDPAMPHIPRAPLEKTPSSKSAQTAIAPPLDPHGISPGDAPAPPSRSLEMSAKTAPTLTSIWQAQQVWFGLATRTWLRALALPAELAACRSLDALLELQRRHITAGVKDAVAGYAELAALSGDSLPRRVGAAGFTSTGV
jgi:hypothetical protein